MARFRKAHANSIGASSTSLKFCILKFLNESLVFTTFPASLFRQESSHFPFCVHDRHRPASPIVRAVADEAGTQATINNGNQRSTDIASIHHTCPVRDCGMCV
jgi:hypothetical protein